MPGVFYIYPQTSGNITITHRYMRNQPDLVAPETSSTVPWFAHTQYLITATAATMMGVTGDDREAEYVGKADKLLAPYLIQEGDEQQAIHRVKLDPRTFKFRRGLKPTKASPF